MQTIYLDPKDATTQLMRRAYPSYNGQKFALKVYDQPGMNLTSHWDGGSRSYFQVIELATAKAMDVPQNGTMFDRGRDFRNEPMPAPGYAVVEHCYFCGKDLGLRLHIHADNAAPMLPAPVELTPAELTVLVFTAGCKASYNGKTRADMAREDTGLPVADWSVAKAQLITRGLLNKSGAITTEGRNATGGTSTSDLRRAYWDRQRAEREAQKPAPLYTPEEHETLRLESIAYENL